MQDEDGTRRAVADIQMRIVMPVRAYRDAGQLMDDVQEAITALLGGHKGARFDFTSFQTQPCKDMTMNQAVEQLRYHGPDVAEPSW